MEQRIFILILIIFLLTTNFSSIFQDITKSLFYLIIIFGIIKIINPKWVSILKNKTTNFINTDGGNYLDIMSMVSSYIKKFLISSSLVNQVPASIDQTDISNIKIAANSNKPVINANQPASSNKPVINANQPASSNKVNASSAQPFKLK
jgi:hypothetical protein